jgi:hypothetical protein
MGRSFRAPAHGDSEEWLKVQTLFALGFRFSRYRSHGGPALPGRFRDVAEFIEAFPDHPLRVAEERRELLPEGQ